VRRPFTEINKIIMPSNEKTDARDKKRYVYRGKSQEDFRKADMEHVTFYTKNYGEFVLSWYMGENTEKPACVADPFAANAAAKKWKAYCDRLARSIGQGGKAAAEDASASAVASPPPAPSRPPAVAPATETVAPPPPYLTDPPAGAAAAVASAGGRCGSLCRRRLSRPPQS
jgi:hypothetical protein